MKIKVYPASLHGCIPAISSKSDVHRKLICAALSAAPSHLRLNEISEDIRATVSCLNALSAKITEEAGGFSIRPIHLDDLPESPSLNCGESGSTLRFLLPVVGALGCSGTFTASGRLPERPLSPLREELESHGCILSPENEWPLHLEGQLQPGIYHMAGNVSSQYFTGLLLALSLLPEESSLMYDSNPESAGYIRMTTAVLEQFGAPVSSLMTGWRIPGGIRFQAPQWINAEGDWSNAAFWLVAGALSGRITLSGLNPDSLQADRLILQLLQQTGTAVSQTDSEITIEQSPLQAVNLDAAMVPDIVPIWTVAAANASGITTIRNAGRLRLKESDRLESISAALNSLGAEIRELPDGLVITGHPDSLNGGQVSGANDHRIVMSLAVAALHSKQPVTIDGAEAVQKSYPHFFDDLNSLGGKIDVLNDR